MKDPPNMKVLVVDDDVAIVDALLLLLQFEGFQPEVAVDGNLVELAARTQPAVILLDVWLSGRDGREVCRQLKKDQRTAAIPVILISASRELAASAAAAGADSYLEKPFEMDTVVTNIRQFSAVV